MAGTQRLGGMIQLLVKGVLQDAFGDFSYSLGTPERKEIIGSGRVLGYSESPMPAFIEGVIVDRGDLDSEALMTVEDVTVTLVLGNGKTIALDSAWQANAYKGETSEGKLEVRFVSAKKGQEVKK